MNALLHLERLWQDLRHGARVFARNRTLTAIAVLSIACGTGANVAMFSVADAMLLRPLPVSRPGELLARRIQVRDRDAASSRAHASYLDYRGSPRAGPQLRRAPRLRLRNRWHDAPRAATRLASGSRSVRQRQLLQRARRDRAARPRIPRRRGTSRRRRRRSSSSRDAFWRADFDGDPAVVGRTMRIGGIDFTIVGVAPESFSGLHPFVREAVFLPHGRASACRRRAWPGAARDADARMFTLKGRLREGVTIAEARAELDTIAPRSSRHTRRPTQDRRLSAQTEFAFKFEQRPLDASLIVLLLALSERSCAWPARTSPGCSPAARPCERARCRCAWRLAPAAAGWSASC